MKLSDIGEFGLLERLAPTLRPFIDRDDVIVGIGDDAAVYRFGGQYLIATTDTMVAGVHFLPGEGPWWELGWKAMAVNLSDIAAMGGWPVFSLVTLALPPDMDVQAIEELYEGIQTCGKMAAAMVIGGDIVRSEQMAITIAAFGRAEQSDSGEPLLLRRDAAKIGDAIVVTGPLGDSAAGYLRLKEGAAKDDPLIDAHLRPRAQLAAGAGAIISGIQCGMDISDGLLQDLGHICKASNVGAVVRAADVPMSEDLRAAYPADALRLACTGGEDYELLLIGPEERVRGLLSEMEMPGAAVIGEVVKDNYERMARVVDESGRDIRFPRPGWDAFKP